MELVGIAVEILHRPALETRLAERIGSAVRLLDPVLGLQVAGLDLVERSGPAGRWRLDLNLLDHVRSAVDLDDHPALEVLGRHHVIPSSQLQTMRVVTIIDPLPITIIDVSLGLQRAMVPWIKSTSP